jgi:glycosyltransferase involved in cell wall biosynthesis
VPVRRGVEGKHTESVTSVAFHVDQLFFKAPGGIGTYVRELVPALARQDPSPELVLFHARFDGGNESMPAEIAGLALERLDSTIRTLYPRWDLLARPPLPERLRATDIVHAPNPAAVPPTADHQRLIVTVHDMAFDRYPALFPRQWRWLYRAGVRAAVRRAHAILTPSRNTAEDLLSRTNARPERIHVVALAPSLDIGESSPAPVLERLRVPEPYLLSVGTLEPRKNLVRLVRAYRRAATGGLPHALVLAGFMGWHADDLLRELTLEGPGRIVMTGGVSGPDLDALYRAASAFVYPSLYEGFGLPPLEAMARGIPTVTSTSSSLSEVAGDAALGIDPSSVPALADAIRRVLTDMHLAADLAERGRARAATFSWDETARRTLQVYEEVARR